MFQTFQQSPVFRLVSFFIIGIIVQYHFQLQSFYIYTRSLSIVFILIPFIPSINRRYHLRWIFGIGVFCFVFSGAGILTAKAWQKSKWETENLQSYIVRILKDPVEKNRTFLCKAEIIGADSLIKQEVIKKKVIIYLPKDSLSSRIVPGNCLHIRAFLKKPQPIADNASFDYPLYLRKQSYAAIGYVKRQNWELVEIPVPAGQWIRFKALEIRRNFLLRLRIILPNPENFSVAAALVFGYTDALDYELRQSFSTIGAGHILSVSGLHFGIIFGICSFFLSFLGERRWEKVIRFLILLFIIWGFAFITGMPPAVVRAACMLSLWLIGSIVSQRSFSFNTLAISAFFMLLYNPLYLFDTGFKLSFSAVLSIIIVNPYLIGLYSSHNPIIKYVWDLSCVSFSAQIGVLPLSIYYFHQIPLLFLVTNLLIIPLSSVLLFLIPFSLVLFSAIGNYSWLMYPLRHLMTWFISITRYIEGIPRSTISNINLNIFDTFLIYVSLACIVYFFSRKKQIQ